MLKEEAVRLIENDFDSRPDLVRAGLSLLEYLYGSPPEVLKHITFGSLARASGLQSQRDILSIAQYLCGARLRLLDPVWEFIDEDEIESLTVEDVGEAHRTRVFYHPRTGELVEDFDRKFYCFFALSSAVHGAEDPDGD